MLRVLSIMHNQKPFDEMYFSADADYVGCVNYTPEENLFLKAEQVIVEYVRDKRRKCCSAKDFILGMTLGDLAVCNQYIEDGEVSWSIAAGGDVHG